MRIFQNTYASEDSVPIIFNQGKTLEKSQKLSKSTDAWKPNSRISDLG